jgi:hypothetical protein
MNRPDGTLKTNILKCEICSHREAVHHGLCPDCAEGIGRLVRIELPEKWRYFPPLAASSQVA